MMFHKIMVPTDGSAQAGKAEDLAISLAEKFDSEIVAVHVIDDKLSQSFAALEAEGNEILNRVQNKGQDRGIAVNEILLFGNPGYDMNNIISKAEADLVVIGAQGRDRAGKILLGSVAEKTVKTSQIPVLVVR